MSYEDYLQSDHWKRTRLKRLLQAELHSEFQYVRCEHSDCRLWIPLSAVEIHHKTYRRLGREEMSDLIVFCGACHADTHKFPRPYWWEHAKSMGAESVTESFLREYRRTKRIGEVMVECLKLHRGEYPTVA